MPVRVGLRDITRCSPDDNRKLRLEIDLLRPISDAWSA